MLYALTCEDKPSSEALRKSIRASHLAYIKNFNVRFAGPLLADDEVTMIGSLIVLESADRAAVDAFAAADPYAQAGLFRSVTIRPFKLAIGA